MLIKRQSICAKRFTVYLAPARQASCEANTYIWMLTRKLLTCCLVYSYSYTYSPTLQSRELTPTGRIRGIAYPSLMALC